MSYTATRSFTLRELERDVETLSMENDVLASEVAEAKRLPKVTERMQMLGLSAPKQTMYLVGPDTLARR